MKDLKHLPSYELIDMLAEQTSLLVKMIKEGQKDEEYDKCKKLLKTITAEIESRKKQETAKKI